MSDQTEGEAANDVLGEIAGVLADVLDRADPADPAKAWAALADAGLLALPAPAAYGGEGLGLAAAAVVIRDAARRAVGLSLHTSVRTTLAVLAACGEGLPRDVVERVIAGELLLVPAVSEPGSALPDEPTTAMTAELVSGRKIAVVSPRIPVGAESVLVVTVTSADGPRVALVEPGAAGVSAASTPDSAGTGEAAYVFDDAPALAVLDPRAAGVSRLHQHLCAAELIALDGLLAGALAMTAGYIGQRTQFGRRLAEFQAVAQQIADVYITSRLTALAVGEVARRLGAGEPAHDDLAIATLWCTDRVVADLQTCHHLHGGVGVDETYPLGAYTSAALDATRRLGGRLAAIRNAPVSAGEGAGDELTTEQRAFKAEVRRYFSGLMTRADQEELLVDRHGPAYHRIIRQMGADGYLGVGWPVAYGGKGLDGIHQAIFANEAARADVHLPAVTLQTVGPTLQEFGTAKQKETFLPRILTGDVHFAIGYSEPDAGTDLAALRTTARRIDGDGDPYYLVNGQKLWTTGGHVADYIWLAARTDPDAPKHAGISILIVDTRDPGFSWTAIRTIDGSHHVNATSFDDVRVPADMLVGEENGGWRLITTQLNHERIMLGPAGRLEGLRDQVLAWAETRGLLAAGSDAGAGVREVLASATASFRVNELLNWEVATAARRERAVPEERAKRASRRAVADASACKVFASAEVQRLGRELHGIVATYGDPADPETAWLLRLLDATVKRNLVLTFGGGVNEVQRELIAQFGLGLPRVPR